MSEYRSVGRASAFRAGGCGFESRGRTIPNGENGTSSSLADARIYRGCTRKIE